MSIRVFAKFHGESIECKVVNAFEHRVTHNSYVLILSPFERKKPTVIPLLFDTEKQIQNAVILSDNKDIEIIDGIINKNKCDIQYSCSDDITFEVRISQEPDSDPTDKHQEFLDQHPLSLFSPKNIDEMIKSIDAQLAQLTREEFISEINKNTQNRQYPSITFILKILSPHIDVHLGHIPINTIDKLLSSKEVPFSTEDIKLLRAFKDIILVFGNSNIVCQDVENALVSFIKCEYCTQELYNVLIHHKSFSEAFSGDTLLKMHNSIILKYTVFFEKKEIESAANYFYYKKEYNSAITLFNALYLRISDSTDDINEKVEMLNSIGCCYIGIGYFNDAYDTFEKAIKIDKKYASIYNNWAYGLITESEILTDKRERHSKLQEALAQINDAILLNPRDVAFISNKAYIEYELGEYHRVLTDLDRARDLSSDYEDIKTILKLSIDSRIKLSFASTTKQDLKFSNLYKDLLEIFENEPGSSKLYFEAFEVFNKIKSTEKQQIIESVSYELMLLEFYISELMKAITLHNPQQGIYYYTSMDNLQRVLCDEKENTKYKLPIFCANHMNDPCEGKEFERILMKHVGQEPMLQDLFGQKRSSTISKRRILESEFTFLKSFSKNDDSLPMWIHYADSGKGCCVKVSRGFFTNFDNDLPDDNKKLTTNPFDNEYRLYDVLYVRDGDLINNVSDEVRQLYTKVISQFSSINLVYNTLKESTRAIVIVAITNIIRKIKYLFKSADYAYEQEMRIVLKRPLSDLKRDDIDIKTTSISEKNPIPKIFIYTNKSILIDEIILGPKVIETDGFIPFFSMKLLALNSFNSEKVLITKSEIEYQ